MGHDASIDLNRLTRHWPAGLSWRTESSASICIHVHPTYHLSWDIMGHVYTLQVAESVLPKPLRDGAYKVIAKAEDLRKKGWMGRHGRLTETSAARKQAISDAH